MPLSMVCGIISCLVVRFLYCLPPIPVYSTEFDACLEEVGPLKPRKSEATSAIGTQSVVLLRWFLFLFFFSAILCT